MTTETTSTPKTVSDLTLGELLTLLRETVTESLAEIVGYPDENQQPSRGAAAENDMDQGIGSGDPKPAHPVTATRVQIVTDEAALAENLARKVSEMEVGELEWWIYYIVDEVGEELIGDPDEGLEFSAWTLERLAQADADRAAGKKGIPLDEVAKRLGLS